MITAATFTPATNAGFLIGEIRGEIDMATARGLRDQLAASVPNTAKGVLLDLSPVPYIDSAGIRLLFGLAEDLQTRRQQLRLVVPEGAPIQTVLRLVDLHAAAPIHPSIDEALAAAEACILDPL